MHKKNDAAKNAKDFSIFASHLEKMIEYTKKMMQYREPDKEIYDALLNQYEEGMDSETIDRLFTELKVVGLNQVKCNSWNDELSRDVGLKQDK